MSNSKRCVVFAVDKFEGGGGECVELYVFDEMFTPIKDEQRDKQLDRDGRVIKVHPSSIADPYKTLGHRHIFAGYTHFGSRVYRAGGKYLDCLKCDERDKFFAKHHISKSVDCWDALTGDCWALPDMKAARVGPRMLLLKGILFAIGGFVSVKHPKFVEYFVEEENAWYTTVNPPSDLYVDLHYFVCGAIEDEGWILIGSKAGKFVVLKPTYTIDGKVSSCIWSSSSIEYNKMLDQCTKSPAAVVDGTKLMWLDRIGTKLIGLDYKSGTYFCIDLFSEGVLPSPKCRHYFPKLVSLGGAMMALVWRDKSLYLLKSDEEAAKDDASEEEEVEDSDDEDALHGFDGFQCTTFKLVQQTLTVISRKKCIGPGQRHLLTAAFVVDVAVPAHAGMKRKRSLADDLTPKIRIRDQKDRGKGHTDDSSMREEVKNKMEEKKDDGTDHPDPQMAELNRMAATLGLKPWRG